MLQVVLVDALGPADEARGAPRACVRACPRDSSVAVAIGQPYEGGSTECWQGRAHLRFRF